MSNSNDSTDDGNDNVYGPELPPNFTNSTHEDDDDFYGPKLPSSLAGKSRIIGATLPNETVESDDDDGLIGPFAADEIDRNHVADNRMKSNPKKVETRERWMLEPGKSLGPASKAMQKSVTKFSQKTSKREMTDEEKMEMNSNKKYDEKMEKYLEEYNKHNKRDQSLMQIHRQNKKSKVDDTRQSLSERREFDRQIDLCSSRMDSKQKKKLINEASNSFGSRFSRGKFEKFLH